MRTRGQAVWQAQRLFYKGEKQYLVMGTDAQTHSYDRTRCVFVMEANVKGGGNAEKALAPVYKIVLKSFS